MLDYVAIPSIFTWTRTKPRVNKHYGLVGYPLSHSFSEAYFNQKFAAQGIPASYRNFELHDLDALREIVAYYKLDGFNVTIPFKEKIIPLLDELDEEAARVGAVNCVVVNNGRLKGYNTDITGFERSLLSFIPSTNMKALVFGSGGASRAVCYVFQKLNMPYQLVTRNELLNSITYADLNQTIFDQYHLLINTTPVGMFPDVNEKLPIPYLMLHHDHYAFDLVYNPEKTAFLAACENQGAHIKNGHDMLVIQAEESYRIFTGNQSA